MLYACVRARKRDARSPDDKNYISPIFSCVIVSRGQIQMSPPHPPSTGCQMGVRYVIVVAERDIKVQRGKSDADVIGITG